MWQITPAELFVVVEGARERARDEAWRFANVIAATVKTDARRLAGMLEMMPVSDATNDDDVDEAESARMIAENRRRRAEAQARRDSWMVCDDVDIDDVINVAEHGGDACKS